MNVGRNDPCPCGSGQKYKKCCMGKDQEAERARQSVEQARRSVDALMPDFPEPPPSPPPPPQDPHIEAINTRWEEFEKCDYEGQITLFLETLGDKELMDSEMAFEMLNIIYHKTIEHGERDRFDTLVDALRERLPAVYAHDTSYYLKWRITNAIVAGRFDTLPAMSNEIATTASKDIDTFNNVLDLLAYHGQLSTLVGAMHIAWPLVKHSTNVVSWGIDEFIERAVNYEIFFHVEHHSCPDAGASGLLRRLTFYTDVDPERVGRYTTHLTGQADRHWMMSDFEFAPPRRRARDAFDDWEEEDNDWDREDQGQDNKRQNLFDLSIEFLCYLRREEGVPYVKGDLGREQIQRYILERHAGELKPRQSMLEAVLHPQKRTPKPRRIEHALCPDRDTLDRYLAGLLNFINPQHYKAAATLELVPAWLRFLESYQLIDAPRRTKALRELCGLDTELLKLWEKDPTDPTLQVGMKHWWMA